MLVMLNLKVMAVGATMLAAVAGTTLSPVVVSAAGDGGTILQRVVRHLRAADKGATFSIKGLARLDPVMDKARTNLAEADKLADQAGVRDGRVEQARNELVEAQQAEDHALALTKDAEQKIDAAIKQILSEMPPSPAPSPPAPPTPKPYRPGGNAPPPAARPAVPALAARHSPAPPS